MKNNQAAKVLLTTCSECKPEEKILFVTDPTSYEVAKIMWEATEEFPYRTMVMMNERTSMVKNLQKVLPLLCWLQTSFSDARNSLCSIPRHVKKLLLTEPAL